MSASDCGRPARWVRAAVSIAALTIGCAGIGAFIGDVWLIDATSGTPRHGDAPLTSSNHRLRSGCAITDAPATIDALASVLFRSPVRDFSSAVREFFRCVDPRRRDRLLVVVREAAAHGDRVADRILDALAQQACRELGILAGAPVERVADPIGCPSVITDTVRVAPHADIVARMAIARLAQLAAVLESEMATDQVRAAFCDAVETAPNLPDAFHARVVGLVDAHCVPQSSTLRPDGGLPDGGGMTR